jgi:hypothetical protein
MSAAQREEQLACMHACIHAWMDQDECVERAQSRRKHVSLRLTICWLGRQQDTERRLDANDSLVKYLVPSSNTMYPFVIAPLYSMWRVMPFFAGSPEPRPSVSMRRPSFSCGGCVSAMSFWFSPCPRARWNNHTQTFVYNSHSETCARGLG